MNKTELTRNLDIEIRKFLPQAEYIFDKKNLSYKYSISDSVFFLIHFDPLTSVIPGDVFGYKLETYITLYNLDIDDVFKAISKRYQLVKKTCQPLLTSDIGTLMANNGFEKIIINSPYYIEVYKEGDFAENHHRFELIFEKYIFPFIEKYKSLEEQYTTLQIEPLKRHIFNMWPAERLMKSIILAKIMGKTDWPHLFSKYESIFNEVFNNDSREEFYRLRALLLGH